MEATTNNPDAGHAKADTAPAPHDPIHDIDAKTTIIWLSFWVVLLGVGLYLLLIVFMHVLHAEREENYERVVSIELEETRARQKLILDGKSSEGVQGMTIDEAMKATAEGRRPQNH